MAKKRYINEDHPVYFSYASNEENYPHIADVADQLYEQLDKIGIKCRISKVDVKCGSINDFEIEIGHARCIIVVFNNKYFRSEHCMNEYAQIVETTKDETTRKIVLINSDGISLNDDTINKLVKYWEDEEANESQYKKPITQSSINHQYYHNPETSFCVQNINNFFSKYSRKKFNADHTLDDNVLDEIITDINDFYIKIGSNPSVPHFTFPVPEHLLTRENEEEALFKSVTENRIVNLVGVGGSGKSYLSSLCLKNHDNIFNEIVYITVNNDIEEDFVKQTNKILRLEFEQNPLYETIAYLQENYKSGKQNLIVLDINETSNKTKNDETINTIIQNKDILEGWTFLILSRENIDTRNRIATYNLNDNENIEFLKELFLAKAGERYNDFGDFAELFKTIFYNPLLAEQLGLFLKEDPETATLEEIKKIFYGESFSDEDMQGMSAESHDEKIIDFLKKLINFNILSDNEKKLLRHFILWQTDYIAYNVIKDLLNCVFESDTELKNTLKSLSKRSILTTDDGKTLSYKLHGLLATSLRKQIDIKEDNYLIYLDNVQRIIKYSYNQFIPYVDCIGNSLCEYDITSNYIVIGNIALTFYRVWKANYSEILFYKAVNMLLFIIRFNSNNLEYQNDLASLYINLANLQKDLLKKYEKAFANYQQAIGICERLPQNNHLFQQNLINAYNNFALLQSDIFQNFKLAKSNYQKAIKIAKKLPKDNSIYQNLLSMLFNNIATLQKDHLKDFKNAEFNFKKAIKICEKLPKNAQYQNDLAGMFYNLAKLQHEDLKKFKLAEENYQKAIELREQLEKENPAFQNDLACSCYNIAILQHNDLKNYLSAEAYYKKAIDIWTESPKENLDYQNNLASAYNNLAGIQYEQQKYDEAKSNIDYAIIIRKQLAESDSYFINDLMRSSFLRDEIFNKLQEYSTKT